MFIEAIELDPPPYPDAHLDYIFISRTLEVNADFTPIESYNGTNTSNRVILDMRFRVMCQQDYYGADCTRFCVAQNDSVNGHYTCKHDGSIQCREGFRNPNNNCSEGELCLSVIKAIPIGSLMTKPPYMHAKRGLAAQTLECGVTNQVTSLRLKRYSHFIT